MILLSYYNADIHHVVTEAQAILKQKHVAKSLGMFYSSDRDALDDFNLINSPTVVTESHPSYNEYLHLVKHDNAPNRR